jgi:hypothetical protein
MLHHVLEKNLFQVGRVKDRYIQGNPFAKHKHITSQKLYPTFETVSTYFPRTKKHEHTKNITFKLMVRV